MFLEVSMIEGLKPLYNTVLRPVARVLRRMGMTPNRATVVGAVLFAGAGILTALGYWRIGVGVAFFGALFDGIDGLIAREFDMKTSFGAVLDSVCDRLTEIFCFAGLLWYYTVTAGGVSVGILLTGAAMSGSLMVSYVRARAEGAGISCSGGFMQRPERLILLAMCQLAGGSVMIWGLGLLSVLSWATVIERIAAVARSAR